MIVGRTLMHLSPHTCEEMAVRTYTVVAGFVGGMLLASTYILMLLDRVESREAT
jgi:hypothetical protein